MNTRLFLLLACFYFTKDIPLGQNYVSLAKVKKGDYYGYIDDDGKTILPCEFEYVSNYVKEGLIRAYKDHNWTYYNVKGQKILDLGSKYSYCGDFSEGLAVVSTSHALLGHYDSWDVRNHDTRFINKVGEEVFQLNEELSSRIVIGDSFQFENGLLNVQVPDPEEREDGIEQLTVFLNKQGEIAIPPLFKEEEAVVYEFHEGLGRTSVWGASKDGTDLVGFVDKEGNFIIPAAYRSATHFKNGVSMVQQQIEDTYYYRYFMINKKGEPVFPDSIDCKEAYYEDVVAVYNGSRYALAKTDGTILTNFRYKNIKVGELCIGELKNQIVFLDRNGKILFETDYIYADGFQDGLCIVVKDWKRTFTGVVNTKNEVIVPLTEGVNFYIRGGVILKYYDVVPNKPIDFQHFNQRGERIDLNAYDKVSYYQRVQIP